MRTRKTHRHVCPRSMIHILLLLITLSVICLSSANAQEPDERASISSSDYTIQGETVLLTVRVSYSYGSEQTLKISVEPYNPHQYYERIINVGPGTDVKPVDFELEPVPSGDSWLVSISLYKSNEKGENLDLLHQKNIDIDLKGAEQINQLGLGGLILILGTAVLGGALYSNRRKRKKKAKHRRKTRRQTKRR